VLTRSAGAVANALDKLVSLGTAQLVTDKPDAVRARAAAEVRTGQAVSLAMPVSPAPIVMGPFAPDTRAVSPVHHLMALTPGMVQAAADVSLADAELPDHVRFTQYVFRAAAFGSSHAPRQ
jgi:hypothetical protein